MFAKTVLLASGLLISLTSSGMTSDLIACSDIEAEWRQSLSRSASAADLNDLTDFYDKAFNDSDCEGDAIERLGQEIIEARLPGLEAQFANSAAGGDYSALRENLDELITFGAHWRVPFLLGEIYRQQRQVGEAFKSYREALSILDDEELTPEIPEQQDIALLRARLDETGLIFAQAATDPDAIKPAVTRSGKPGSAMDFATRGYKRKKTLVPIQFVFGKAEMTDVGKASFGNILNALERQGAPAIQVIGHTDPVGSDDDNMALSILRAQAVRQQLQDAGYKGAVDISGKGEAQPFRFDDPGLYSKEQRHQAHRRVEFVLK